MFGVGQLVRSKTRKPGVYEVVRVLVSNDGVPVLYVIRGARGAERTVRHDELKRA